MSTSPRHAAVAQKAKASRAEVVSFPSISELERDEDEDEPEIDLVPPEQVSIQLTDRAAEVCLASHVH